MNDDKCAHDWALKYIDGATSMSDWECNKCHEYRQVPGTAMPAQNEQDDHHRWRRFG